MNYEEREKLKLRAQDFELNVPPTPAIDEKEIDFKKFRNLNGVKAKDDVPLVDEQTARYWAGELIKCEADPIYFAEKYFYIISYKGKQVIKLFDKQKEILRCFEENPYTVVLSGRQQGKSLVAWSSIRVKQKSTGIIKTMTIDEFNKMFPISKSSKFNSLSRSAIRKA